MKIKALFCIAALMLPASQAAAQKAVLSSSDPCAGFSAKATVDWTAFLFNSCHTGYNPNEFILSPSTVGNLVLGWRYKTGYIVGSSPAVADGVLYIGSYDHNVYALNAGTGALLWKYTTGN